MIKATLTTGDSIMVDKNLHISVMGKNAPLILRYFARPYTRREHVPGKNPRASYHVTTYPTDNLDTVKKAIFDIGMFLLSSNIIASVKDFEEVKDQDNLRY